MSVKKEYRCDSETSAAGLSDSSAALPGTSKQTRGPRQSRHLRPVPTAVHPAAVHPAATNPKAVPESPKAVILAAGLGSRLANGIASPKPLRQISGTPLIVRVLRNLELAGFSDVAIVIGYLGEKIRAHLRQYDFSMQIHFVENEDWLKPNGTSLLKAKDFVDRPTYLFMSDHLWAPGLLQAVQAFETPADHCVLGVDYNIAGCFDLPDATKVKVHENEIVSIGKELKRFDALDTGVFRITPLFMDVLSRIDGQDGCSLSQGVAKLAADGKMHAVDIGQHAWLDVDTPQAHAYAESTIERYEARVPSERQQQPTSAQALVHSVY